MGKSRDEVIRFANEELLAKGNLDVVEEVFDAEYVVHASGKEHRGHAFVRRFVKQLRVSIANLRVVAVTVFVQDGDKIVWERTLAGTHAGDLAGIPGSGKKVEWRDIVISRFEGERIAEEWTVSELAGVLFSKQARG